MRLTEQPSNYENLDKMTTAELLCGINNEDKSVPLAVEKCIPQIEKLVDAIVERMHDGGRLFYLGAGTSGRLGIVDASEIPPTYGVDDGVVIGVIAGGDGAIRKAVENAEDDSEGGWHDIEKFSPTAKDVVVGIAASGRTPYAIGALQKAKSLGILTACITNNPDSEITKVCDIPIACATGAEFVTGSTRMKAGTSQKLILNMISTCVMIKMGRVRGNRMVDMQLTNLKLVDRGTKMILDATDIDDYEKAKELLLRFGSVREAVDFYNSQR